MLFYRAAVDLSRSTLNYVAGLIRRHRKRIGSTWRLLNPGRQALLVLVYLRKNETFAEISAGFGVSATTAWRYVEETVMLLSARSPTLRQALRKAGKDGLTHVILDGTLIHIDRVAADRPFFSGKHRVHGMNIQVIAGPDGTILWTSGALPGKTHDLTAARIWGIPRELEKAEILTLTDKAYQGAEATVVITPYKGRNKPESQKRANRSLARLRGPGERANAQLSPGGSSANSAAAPTRPATSSRPSPFYRTTAPLSPPEDEMSSVNSALIFICSDQTGPYLNALSYLSDKRGVSKFTFVFITGAMMEGPQTIFTETIISTLERLADGVYFDHPVTVDAQTRARYASLACNLRTANAMS